METIIYEYDALTDSCFTSCPNPDNERVRVGSVTCQGCQFFYKEGYDYFKRQIMCSFDETKPTLEEKILNESAERFRRVACPLTEASKVTPRVIVPSSCEACKDSVGSGINPYCTEVMAIKGIKVE